MRTLLKLGLAVAVAAAAIRLLRRGGAAGDSVVPPPAPASSTAAGPIAAGEAVEGYCVRERKKVPIEGAQPTVTKNGRQAVKGSCPDCGATIFRFV